MTKTSAQFYKEIGVKGIAARKKATHTKKELAYLKKFLNKRQKILDLACGYGRFTIPLAKQGYNIEGADISQNLLNAAKKTAKKQRLKIRFRLADMRKLPYKKDSFDVILCMWSAFLELSKKKDQMKALKEMLRTLNLGGFALLEMPKPMSRSELLKSGEVIKMKNRVGLSKISDIESVPMFYHSKQSLTGLMKNIKPKKYKVFVDDFGGRKRLLLLFWK